MTLGGFCQYIKGNLCIKVGTYDFKGMLLTYHLPGKTIFVDKTTAAFHEPFISMTNYTNSVSNVLRTNHMPGFQ